MRRHERLIFLSIAALGLLAGPAAAADIRDQGSSVRANAQIPVSEPSPLSPDWLVTIQIGGGTMPTYPGAKYYRPAPVPGLEVRRADEPRRFSTPDDAFGVPILDANGFHIGPVANLMIPRWRTHKELTGLHRVETAFEFGGYVEYYPADLLRTRLELRQGLYGHHGMVATFSADLLRYAGPLTISAGPRVNFSTDAYADAYYSVTPYQSLANGHVPAYKAEGGLTSAGFMATARYDFNAVWNSQIYGGWQRLTDSVAGSPIPTMLGSRNQFTAGLQIGRTFGVPGF